MLVASAHNWGCYPSRPIVKLLPVLALSCADYNVYSKAWRTTTEGSGLYRPRTAQAGEFNAEAADAQIKELQTSQKFKSTTDFEGVERGAGAPRAAGPVQFEKAHAGGGGGGGTSADPFGLDQFLSDTKRGGKNALDAVGKSAGHGFMAAAGGGASKSAADYAHPSRDRINFTSGGTQK